MTPTGKFLMLSALLCLAILCVAVGTVVGAVAFIALGVLLELAFWLGIFKKASKRQPAQTKMR
ncbi:hypothetical protein [Alteromonas gilva]|uniref:Phosphatidate cytidylyltransferase n=1 Tax=Alteromonas gilva TaxID=2987522 RepID=A0ABT5L1D6_9ALTE|nr:hypothetical protein [Alteromonas gilva]MDC8830845.1 hypothetical protein [Alteromonas gilva]